MAVNYKRLQPVYTIRNMKSYFPELAAKFHFDGCKIDILVNGTHLFAFPIACYVYIFTMVPKYFGSQRLGSFINAPYQIMPISPMELFWRDGFSKSDLQEINFTSFQFMTNSEFFYCQFSLLNPLSLSRLGSSMKYLDNFSNF